MKTPDEIKRFLTHCADGGACVKCHYDKRDFPQCIARLHGDALALIRQIEVELRDAEAYHQHTIDVAEKQKEQIGRLKAVIVKMNKERVPRWISVEERLPEPNVAVLTCSTNRFNGEKEICEAWHNGLGTWEMCEGYVDGVTHWMPMPLPPSSPDGESTSLGDGG